MIASPFTGRPAASTARQRSASPSNAMPQAAPGSRTAAATASRCVEPTPALMLRPSGATPMKSTETPSRANSAGAAAYAAPLAQSTTDR